MRYEHFARPLPLCLSIFNFVFNSTKHDGRKACSNLFLSRPAVSTSMDRLVDERSSRKRRAPRRLAALISPSWNASTHNDEHHFRRQLRLRSISDSKSLQFRPELVNDVGMTRMKEFWQMEEKLPQDVRRKLATVNDHLKRFGYSLYEIYSVKPSTLSSQLEKWELKS